MPSGRHALLSRRALELQRQATFQEQPFNAQTASSSSSSAAFAPPAPSQRALELQQARVQVPQARLQDQARLSSSAESCLPVKQRKRNNERTMTSISNSPFFSDRGGSQTTPREQRTRSSAASQGARKTGQGRRQEKAKGFATALYPADVRTWHRFQCSLLRSSLISIEQILKCRAWGPFLCQLSQSLCHIPAWWSPSSV